MTDNPLLDVRGLKKQFILNQGDLFAPKKILRAVDGITFTVNPGETLGIVGESRLRKNNGRKMYFTSGPTHSGPNIHGWRGDYHSVSSKQ